MSDIFSDHATSLVSPAASAGEIAPDDTENLPAANTAIYCGTGGDLSLVTVSGDTVTFLGALRSDRLAAPCVFDGPINGQCFHAYVEQQLVSVLKPGDIVIIDNLGSHKSVAIRQAIKAAGARLWFLPPYWPDLNPIEQAFSKVKHWMRDAQKRTIDDAWRHIGSLVDTIQPDECANYLTNAGYASVKT